MARSNNSTSPVLAIVITLTIACILNLLRYPEWMEFAKPDWVLLVLFYWSLALPQRVGVGWGWCMGLILDILYYSILGQHAIAKAFVALIAVSAHRRLRLYDLWQQCIIVFMVASVDIGITVWVAQIISGSTVTIHYWQSALTSALLWPVIYILLRQLRHKKGIR